MKFDFDRSVDRRGTHSYKWDRYAESDVLPFWLADMEFSCPQPILKAMQERMRHPIFGYTTPGDEIYDAILGYLRSEKGIPAEAEWIVWLPGIVPALGAFCRAFTRSGDGVMLNTPVYPQFISAPLVNKQRSVTVPLLREGMYYSFDWSAMRDAAYAAKLLLLCNPQNPTGRVYSRGELEQLVEFCERNDMLICSDEIHCDMVIEPGMKHTSILAIDEARERSILLMSPSKTFNTPGLSFAFAVIPDEHLREVFRTAMRGNCEWVNSLGVEAARAGYGECADWRRELVAYLRKNRDFMRNYISKHIPQLKMGPVEATYMAWLDANSLGVANPAAFFEESGVGLSDGAGFGEAGMLRMNIACPAAMLHRGLERMREAVDRLQHSHPDAPECGRSLSL